MRRWLVLITLLLPLVLASAADWQLVRVPAPKNPQELFEAGFNLFHRAGEYWIGSLPVGVTLPNAELFPVYTPENGDLFRLLVASTGEIGKLAGNVNLLYATSSEAVFQATPEQLQNLPIIRGEWIRITTTPKFMGYLGVENPATDDFHPFVQELVNQVDQVSYTGFVQSLQDFVTRNTHTTQCDLAADWIRSQFESYGLTAHFHNFQISGNTKHNVVAELPGLLYPDSVIFVTSHYDATAGNPYSAEPNAPGADDNGSGTAAVIECARILSQYNFEKTIQFVTFAAEEQGDVGSGAFVDDLPGMGIDVVGSFNYDMIAYSGNDPLPPDMVIYSDNNPLSQAMAYKIEEAILTFVPNDLEPDVDINPSMGSSDHGPFWDAGLPAICGIEEQAWGPDFNPWYHSVNDLVSNCDLEYATNCTRAAIAALADYAVPIVGNGPYVSIDDQVIDEVTGNGNHAPDPGETISIGVTLINVGNEPATGISATLSSTDPYLTITQNSATYPDLAPQATGAGSQAYIIDISSSCPQGQLVTNDLLIEADGGYTNTVPINFIVGDPVYDPTGPDNYGYLAYDSGDEPLYPQYDWVEVCPDSGGAGTLVNFTVDDQCLQFDLPFSFRYYGSDYTRFTIAANGWIGMGDIIDDDYSNSGIPNNDGPAGMIAVYWEDLSPQRANSGKVWQYYDTANNRLIVEYNHVEQYSPTGNFETFQLILLDPAYYPTQTGDGQMIFQYKDISGSFQSEGTVGIEDPTETMGLQYLYDGGYDVHAADITDQSVIFFDPPAGIPDLTVDLTYLSGSPVPPGGGNINFDIYVINISGQTLTFDAWLEVAFEGGSPITVVYRHIETFLPGWTIDRPNTYFPVPGTYAAGNYTLAGKVGVHPTLVWAEDSFPFVKSGAFDGSFIPFVPDGVPDVFGGEFGNSVEQPVTPEKFALLGAYPNPFNPTTTISYKLQNAAYTSLKVFDVQGREVATLVNGYRNAGSHDVTFNGADLASGVYLYRLESDDLSATGKMVL